MPANKRKRTTKSKKQLFKVTKPLTAKISVNDPAVLQPTKYHVELMKKVINSEPKLIQGHMVCKDHGHCSAGALLAAVGCPEDLLDSIPQKYGKRLYDMFRITSDDLDRIMARNDSVNGDKRKYDSYDDEGYIIVSDTVMQKRRNAVNKLLESFSHDKVARWGWNDWSS